MIRALAAARSNMVVLVLLLLLSSFFYSLLLLCCFIWGGGYCYVNILIYSTLYVFLFFSTRKRDDNFNLIVIMSCDC